MGEKIDIRVKDEVIIMAATPSSNLGGAVFCDKDAAMY
jgi:hypothetical protein